MRGTLRRNVSESATLHSGRSEIQTQSEQPLTLDMREQYQQRKCAEIEEFLFEIFENLKSSRVTYRLRLINLFSSLNRRIIWLIFLITTEGSSGQLLWSTLCLT